MAGAGGYVELRTQVSQLSSLFSFCFALLLNALYFVQSVYAMHLQCKVMHKHQLFVAQRPVANALVSCQSLSLYLYLGVEIIL